MPDTRIYYVYEHWRPDTDVCFYVGKGKGKRAWDLRHMRNRHYKAVVAKLERLGLSVDVRLILRDVAEDTALHVEIDRIAFYGQPNLTNMTSGGDGLKNPSPETRAAISRAQKKRFKNPEELLKLGARAKGRKTSDETKRKLSAALRGRKMTPEQLKKMRAAAKKRGVSQATRDAHRKALTGRKRAPFTPETITRMRAAATKREEARRRERAGGV